METDAAATFFATRQFERRLAVTPSNAMAVATWNTLADSLSDAFPHCTALTKSWAHRRPLIVAEVARFVCSGFMVALQEVDHFDELLAGVRAAHAQTDAVWRKKVGDGADGVALFWDTRAYSSIGPVETVRQCEHCTPHPLCLTARRWCWARARLRWR